MPHHRILLTVSIILSLAMLIAPLSAAIIHVDDSAPAGGDGTSWNLAFTDLQDALDAAAGHDEIRVAQGIYHPTRRIDPTDPRSVSFEMIENVGIYGGYAGYGAPDPDARDVAAYTARLSGDLYGDDGPDFTNRTDNSYHVIFNNENYLSATAILDGFTISGGYADVATQFNQGGGVFIRLSSPTLSECTVTDNWAHNSAGISINESSATLNRCSIVDNTAGVIGGGVIVSDEGSAVLNECTIAGNKANLGAGMSVFSATPTLTGCAFIENIDGGGLHNLDSSPILIECEFVANSGGGMLNDLDSEPHMIRCNFIGNTSDQDGGAIANLGSMPVMENCLFIANETEGIGGAIFSVGCGPDLRMTNCTFALNSALESGGALANSNSYPVLANCILWGDVSGSPPATDEIFNDFHAVPDVTYCNIEGGYPGTGNIDSDPLFANPAGGDFHLTWGSPCRNAGDDSAVAGAEDFEGDPRITGFAVDMGADEYWHHLYLAGDPVPGGIVTLNVVGVPGTNPVRIYRGSLRANPLSTQYGFLYIKQPFTHIWNVGPIPAGGIASVSRTIPGGVDPGAEFYFQVLHGQVGDPASKLSNLLTVKVE